VGSNLTGGQPAKLPSFGGYNLETFPYLVKGRVDSGPDQAYWATASSVGLYRGSPPI